jgi:hypothetical protein
MEAAIYCYRAYLNDLAHVQKYGPSKYYAGVPTLCVRILACAQAAKLVWC